MGRNTFYMLLAAALVAVSSIMPAIVDAAKPIAPNPPITTIQVTGKNVCILVDSEPACSEGAGAGNNPSAWDVTGELGSDVISVIFFALYPQSSSKQYESPGCVLMAKWPSKVTSVTWFNDTSLYYEYKGKTYYETCSITSLHPMLNPYYAPSTGTVLDTPTSKPRKI